MGIFSFFKKKRANKPTDLMIDSMIESSDSKIQSDKSLIEHQSINQSQIIKPQMDSEKGKSSVSLEKDSLHLGIAAGYTGHAIKEIEASLARIEANMTTKDWFSLFFKDTFDKKLEDIQASLNILLNVAQQSPEPYRKAIQAQVNAIETTLPLTQKMKSLIQVVKITGQISYTDLAQKLGITENALRGLLSTTARRTREIQRAEKDGKGWVMYIGPQSSDSITNQSVKQPSDTLNEPMAFPRDPHEVDRLVLHILGTKKDGVDRWELAKLLGINVDTLDARLASSYDSSSGSLLFGKITVQGNKVRLI